MTYTLIIFDNENKCLESYPDLMNPKIKESDLESDNLQIRGINQNFIVLEGTIIVEPDAIITAEQIAADKKDELKTAAESQAQQIDMLQQMVNEIMFGGM